MQQLFEDEQSISSQLTEISNLLSASGRMNTKVEAIADRFLAVTEELNDIGRQIEKVADNTEYDEERITESQQRLDIIYRLQQKHSVKDLDALLLIQKELEEKSDSFANQSQEEEKLERQIAGYEKSLMVKAREIQQKDWPLSNLLNKRYSNYWPNWRCHRLSSILIYRIPVSSVLPDWMKPIFCFRPIKEEPCRKSGGGLGR